MDDLSPLQLYNDDTPSGSDDSHSLPPSYATSPTHPGVKRTQPEIGHRSSISDRHQHKRQDGRFFTDDLPSEMERQTVEQEEIPPTGPQIWLPPRQHPEETLVEFHNRPHQDHSNLDEHSLYRPPLEAR